MDDSPQPQREALMARCPNKRIPDEAWPAIRTLIESGVPYKEVAAQYGVSDNHLRTRAAKEKWITPYRLARAKNGTMPTDDPANAVAELWRRRGVETRDTVYQGSKRALERFFAMSPVPQSFAEAATALKMVNDAINPNGTPSDSTKNVSISILATKGFQPSPVVDI